MNYTQGWKEQYPFIAKIPGRPDEPSKWLRTQFGNDHIKLSSGRRIGINSKDGIWAYDNWDISGSTYRFCKEEYKTWFLMRWG